MFVTLVRPLFTSYYVVTSKFEDNAGINYPCKVTFLGQMSNIFWLIEEYF